MLHRCCNTKAGMCSKLLLVYDADSWKSPLPEASGAVLSRNDRRYGIRTGRPPFRPFQDAVLWALYGLICAFSSSARLMPGSRIRIPGSKIPCFNGRISLWIDPLASMWIIG